VFTVVTNQTAESGDTEMTVVTPKNLPTPAENACAWWKRAARVYPEATLRAWRFDWASLYCLLQAGWSGAVAGVTVDRRRLH
jgi:hypothetical protein